MKKKILCSLGIIAVVLAVILLFRGRVIGTVKGAEMEQIVIDDVVYQQNNDTGLSYRDKGRFIGRATIREETEEKIEKGC